ncbi:MAG: DUF4381 domain-containing protein [Haliea sp.]|nr:DUF4381 domain-containing protein [Haliea sp.]
MSADPTGLDKLHDILVPPPVPWWPPAPGWYWVLGLAAVIGAVLLWRAVARWQRNHYRREALAELAQIEARLDANSKAPVDARIIASDTQARTHAPNALTPDAALAAMAVLLKRTALTAYAREQVASLTGPAWFAFLDNTGGTRFSDGLGAALARANYHCDSGSGERAASECIADVANEIRRWIAQHRAYDQTSATEPGSEPTTGPTTRPAQTAPRKTTAGNATEAA